MGNQMKELKILPPLRISYNSRIVSKEQEQPKRLNGLK